MKIIVDTHVHVYPNYDLGAFLRNTFRNLEKLSPGSSKMICLTEGAGYSFFDAIQQHGLSVLGFSLEKTPDANMLRIVDEEDRVLFILAGRQIVTIERLEVLALGMVEAIPDGLKIEDVLQQVGEQGALPVISWAPGKWFLKRGTRVKNIINSGRFDELMLGDTSLRPPLWLEPILMRLGRRKGLPVLGGSDPLPVAGEEKYAGSYATLLEGDFDEDQPFDSFKSMVMNLDVQGRRVGLRCSVPCVLGRLSQHRSSKKHG